MHELTWLAGLLEGEGCFTYESGGNGRRYLRVTLGMTDRDVVERAAALMPGATFSVSHPPSRQANNAQPLYVARCSRTAEQVMLMVLPCMGARRAAKIKQNLAKFREDRST